MRLKYAHNIMRMDTLMPATPSSQHVRTGRPGKRAINLSLSSDVHADAVTPGSEQAFGDRTDFAIGDRKSVEPGCGHDAVGSAGEEDLVSGVHIIGLKSRFPHWQAEFSG